MNVGNHEIKFSRVQESKISAELKQGKTVLII